MDSLLCIRHFSDNAINGDIMKKDELKVFTPEEITQLESLEILGGKRDAWSASNNGCTVNNDPGCIPQSLCFQFKCS